MKHLTSNAHWLLRIALAADPLPVTVSAVTA